MWARRRNADHILVALAAAIVALLPQVAGMSGADASRIIQGASGVGFIGGGVILKMSEEHQILGITTAAGIWLTAAIGIATGTGRTGPGCRRYASGLYYPDLLRVGSNTELLGRVEPSDTPPHRAKK